MIKPLGDRIVIKPLEEKEQKTVAGLVIPDSAKEKPQEGEVVALGTKKCKCGCGCDCEKSGKDSKNCKCDCKCTEFDVKVGEKVIYSKYSGTEITIDGTDHLIVNESDILAVV